MYEAIIASICTEALEGTLDFSEEYAQRLVARPTPGRHDVYYAVCEDDPMVIEWYPDDPRGQSCLLWGIISDGRIAHMAFSNPPNVLVITAYLPAETEPEEWTNNYRTRVQRPGSRQ